MARVSRRLLQLQAKLAGQLCRVGLQILDVGPGQGHRGVCLGKRVLEGRRAALGIGREAHELPGNLAVAGLEDGGDRLGFCGHQAGVERGRRAVVGHGKTALAAHAHEDHAQVLLKDAQVSAPILRLGQGGKIGQELVPGAQDGKARELFLGAHDAGEVVALGQRAPGALGFSRHALEAHGLGLVGVDRGHGPALAGLRAHGLLESDLGGRAVGLLEAQGKDHVAARALQLVGRAGRVEVLFKDGHGVAAGGEQLVEAAELLVGAADVGVEVLRQVVVGAGRTSRGRGLRGGEGVRRGGGLGIRIKLGQGLGRVGDGQRDGRDRGGGGLGGWLGVRLGLRLRLGLWLRFRLRCRLGLGDHLSHGSSLLNNLNLDGLLAIYLRFIGLFDLDDRLDDRLRRRLHDRLGLRFHDLLDVLGLERLDNLAALLLPRLARRGLLAAALASLF